MQDSSDQMNLAYQFLKARGIARPRELKAAGIPESYLWELSQEGKAQHLGRGLYALNELEITEYHSLVEAAHYVPKGIVCLISALQFHELTTQLPGSVWLALPAHAHRPHIPHLSVELIQIKPELMKLGVETHTIQGTQVRIFSPARTIADCFKFRGRIGMDVALEALKLGLEKGIKANEIWSYAGPLRVGKTLLPYLEALA